MLAKATERLALQRSTTSNRNPPRPLTPKSTIPLPQKKKHLKTQMDDTKGVVWVLAKKVRAVAS